MPETESPVVPKKLLEQNIVWFAIGLVVAGAIGAVAFLGFLDQRIDARVAEQLPESLTNQISLLDKIEGVPQGAVMAVEFSGSAEPKCPDGWSRFSRAGGRFIVGAGPHTNKDQRGQPLREYRQEEDGGTEKHALDASELPPHQHGYVTSQNDQYRVVDVSRVMQNSTPNARLPLVDNEGVRYNWAENLETDTGIDLDGSAHNNMPPFIALYFCKYGASEGA